MLFQQIITRKTWGEIFQSKDAFAKLIQYIMQINNLPTDTIDCCRAGTNAVFAIGNYVAKIFAPREAMINSNDDFNTELFGLQYANYMGVKAPKVIADGTIHDRYDFNYIVMERISGTAIGDVVESMNNNEKIALAKSLRAMTDKFNHPCTDFQRPNIYSRTRDFPKFKQMPLNFQRERLEYLSNHIATDLVYVHGDINPDNVLLNGDEIHLIDFADATIAPIEYEYLPIIFEIFEFDKIMLKVFLGQYESKELTDKLFDALLLHECGYDLIKCNLGEPSSFNTLDSLREILYTKLK